MNNLSSQEVADVYFAEQRPFIVDDVIGNWDAFNLFRISFIADVLFNIYILLVVE